MGNFAVEFDFIEDDSGDGRFVAAGGSGFQVVSALAAKGDLAAAAKMYEEAPPQTRALLVKEAELSSVATRRSLLEVLKRARDYSGAAALADGLGAHPEAAQLHEAAHELAPAAEAWLRAGEHRRAAANIERLGDFARALELYRAANDKDGEARCLARLGKAWEAAAAYRAAKNAHAELQLLMAIPAGDPNRRAAILRASELLDENGHPQKALPLLYGEMRANEQARADFAYQTELVRLLRRTGRDADAEKVLAQLQGKVAPAASAEPPVVQGTPVAEPAPDEGYEFLKAIPLFGGIGLPDMKDLYCVAKRVAVPAGMTLIQKGARDSGLYVLLDGEVEVSSGTRVLNTLGAGAYLGEISLLLDAPTSATVKAKSKVKALLISRENFQRFLDTHEAAALKVWRLFAESLADRVRALSNPD